MFLKTAPFVSPQGHKSPQTVHVAGSPPGHSQAGDTNRNAPAASSRGGRRRIAWSRLNENGTFLGGTSEDRMVPLDIK